MSIKRRQSRQERRSQDLPRTYDPSICPAVLSYCRAGATDIEVADLLGIDVRTLFRWRSLHAELRAVLTTGDEDADNRVVRSLYHRACGYAWDEDKPVKLRDITYENGRRVRARERVEIATVRRSLPPDLRAATFWLKNRRPDSWSDKREHEHTGEAIGHLELASPRDLAIAIKAILE